MIINHYYMITITIYNDRDSSGNISAVVAVAIVIEMVIARTFSNENVDDEDDDEDDGGGDKPCFLYGRLWIYITVNEIYIERVKNHFSSICVTIGRCHNATNCDVTRRTETERVRHERFSCWLSFLDSLCRVSKNNVMRNVLCAHLDVIWVYTKMILPWVDRQFVPAFYIVLYMINKPYWSPGSFIISAAIHTNWHFQRPWCKNYFIAFWFL